jgi:hypothetical protein
VGGKGAWALAYLRVLHHGHHESLLGLLLPVRHVQNLHVEALLLLAWMSILS